MKLDYYVQLQRRNMQSHMHDYDRPSRQYTIYRPTVNLKITNTQANKHHRPTTVY